MPELLETRGTPPSSLAPAYCGRGKDRRPGVLIKVEVPVYANTRCELEPV